MRRRFILALPALAVLASCPALAQRAAGPAVVGVLMWPEDSSDNRQRIIAHLVRGLEEAGYAEGRDIRLVYRFAGRDPERAVALVRELDAMGAAVIVAVSTPAATAAAKAKPAAPIVIASAADPVGTGLVASLAQPGGNITGMSFSGPELSGKRLELLRELIPGLGRVALLLSAKDPAARLFESEAREAAQRAGLALRVTYVSEAAEFRAAFAGFRNAGSEALIVQPIFATQRGEIAAFAREFRLPWISDFPEFAAAGAPISYGADLSDILRRAGFFYVDRILKGAKPADMPIQQPTVFQLVVNQRAARDFGLVVAPAILARADEVIE